MTQITPLGNRIVIQPDPPAGQTESGFIIPDAYQQEASMSGIVTTLGTGSLRERHIRRAVIARCLAILDDAEADASSAHIALTTARDEMVRYMQQTEDLGHVCTVGQRVIFPMEAGHEIVLNEDNNRAVVIIAEDSILAVYDAEGVAA